MLQGLDEGQADREAIEAADLARGEFVSDLNTFHVMAGAPSYKQIETACGGRPSKATIAEMLGGKRLPSLDVVMAFTKAVNELSKAAGLGRDAEAEQQLREQWSRVKLVERRAVVSSKRVRESVEVAVERARDEARRIVADAERTARELTENAGLLRHNQRKRIELAFELWRGDFEEVAARGVREVLPELERLYGPDDPDTLLASFYQVLFEGKGWQEVADHVNDVSSILGPSHPTTLHMQRLLLFRLPDETVIANFGSLLEELERVLGPDAKDTLVARYYHAQSLMRRGPKKEARRTISRLLSDVEASPLKDTDLPAQVRHLAAVLEL